MAMNCDCLFSLMEILAGCQSQQWNGPEKEGHARLLSDLSLPTHYSISRFFSLAEQFHKDIPVYPVGECHLLVVFAHFYSYYSPDKSVT